MFLLSAWYTQAQVKGQVKEAHAQHQGHDHGEAETLPGVNVFWLGTSVGTTTDASGKFNIQEPETYPAKLVFSYVGFQSDTLMVASKKQKLEVSLKSSLQMEEIVVAERKQSTTLDLMKTINVETLGEGEISRAACCNISEAFETNASIDVVSSDGVTGAKKIQMLGLDGIYTGIQAENVPYVRGLANFDGLGHVPGTWVESIQIIKGTGSVVNGYEPMTGQINLELLKPDELKERLFVNVYANAMGRMEANVHVGDKINGKWSTLLLAHANTINQKNDNNNDGFLDLPLRNQLNVHNRWKYKGDDYMAQFGVQALVEDRQGGQVDFNPERDYATTNRYGTGSEASHIQGYFKNGFVFDGFPARSVAFISRGSYYNQSYYMGLRNYNGTERYLYGNFIFSDMIRTTDHKYKIGASYVYDDYNEEFNGKRYQREENVPGVFGEYTYSNDNFGAVVGLRSDFHNLYGTQVNPKVNLKYNFSDRGVVRVSGGRGFRVANIFAENASTFVNQRVITIQNNLLPEIAWNTGGGITQKVQIAERDFTMHGEYFYTYFENQVLVDRELPGELIISNLNGESYSHAVQTELGYEPWKVLNVRVAAKYLEVISTYSTGQQQAPLIPNWRGMFTVGYKTINEKWQADFTTQFVGISRVPSTIGNLPENVRSQTSDPYTLLNAQATRRFRWWEVYVGVENLLGYKQPNAIISADKPFDPEFDGSMIWAPVQGQSVYLGLRLRFFRG